MVFRKEKISAAPDSRLKRLDTFIKKALSFSGDL